MKLLLLCTVLLAGCSTFQKTDGTTGTKIDPVKVTEGAAAIAPFAGPWGLVLTAAAGLVAAVANKDDKGTK